MDKHELVDILQDDSKWTKTTNTNELWTYIKITDRIKVGRHKYDWAVFKLGKNVGFHMASAYRQIPQTLINQLLEMVNKPSKKIFR